MSLARPPISARLFRASLVLFPTWFRAKYGEDMVLSFTVRAEQLAAEGATARRIAFIVFALLEVPGAAGQVRRGAKLDIKAFFEGSSHAWLDDLRQAVRSLARSPAWTSASLGILALGIGGTTAVFSLLNAVYLRPLPFESPDRLVSIWTVNRGQRDGSSVLNAEDWVERSPTLASVALVMRPEFSMGTVRGLDEPERIQIGLVSHGFFDLLGAEPVIGRVFDATDLDGGVAVAVISEALWETRFGRDPDIVGRTVNVEGTEVDIVGVVPSRLAIPARKTHLWRLEEPDRFYGANLRDFDSWWVLGRLAEGATVETARIDLGGVAEQLALEYPDTNREFGVQLTSLRAEIVGDRLPLLLWTLFGSMVLALLVGGTNVAQLNLGRGVARRRELAIRGALGATRVRVSRQLLLESVLVSVVAGFAGIGLALVTLPLLVSTIPSDVPLIDGSTIDATVLAVTVLVVGVVAPLVGLLPAVGASRTSMADILRSGGRGSTPGDRRLGSVLVVGEIAAAVVLLSGATLLARSAMAINGVDPGFDAERTLIMHVDLSVSEDDALARADEDLVRRVAALPGVLGAGVTGGFFVDRIPDQRITMVGEVPRAVGDPVRPLTSEGVFPGFFESLGVPLVGGRALSVDDIELGMDRPVAVNSAWVRAFSPQMDPVGRRFTRGATSGPGAPTFSVVGVVEDVRQTELEFEPIPQIFYPEIVGPALDLVVRTTGDPRELTALVREAVRQVDSGAAISGVGRIWDRYRDGMAPRRFQTFMLSVLAAFATLMAAVGLFAVLHETVTARRREVGIRIALGADPRRVLGMVLGSGLGLAVVGLTIGLALALLLSDVFSRFVYGIESTDPVSLASVAGLLLVTALFASSVPAWRAATVSPIDTLSEE